MYDCHLISKLKAEYRIPKRTLYNWKEQPEVDIDWRPYNKRKRSDKTFSAEQEQSISNFIKTNMIDQHKHFQDADFTKLVYSTTNEEGINRKDFRCSHHFVSDFKT